MSCDDNYTKVAKPTASYTIAVKPTASYTITAKGTRPTTTKVPRPCIEDLAILTEGGIEILYENEIIMVVQGALV